MRNAQFAKRLQTLMDNRGLTQSGLAARLSVHRVLVQGWVTSRHFPARDNLERLARALEVKVKDLVPAGFDVRS